MIGYLLRRLSSLAVIITGMVALVFVMTRTLPGSPVETMLGAKPTAEQIEQARHELGLDQPLPVQFGRFAWQALRGDLGTSLRTNRPVGEEIAVRLSASAELVTLSLLLAMVIGIPMGVWAAAGRGGPVDYVSRVASVSLVAVPAFFLGVLLQMLFYGKLGWLPLNGRIDSTVAMSHPVVTRTGWLLIDAALAGETEVLRSALRHLVLPVATLGGATLATIIRVTRNLMVEVLATDYVRTARAYGVSRRRILFRFALKATFVPLLTVIGLTYGYLLGGSVIVEYVFDWPGIGGYIVESVVGNDFPAVIGVTLIVSTAYLLINLVVDLLYFRLDPKLSR
ncbi:ABC transporter permease [Variovorax paradoxus]|uniref:ABC transporter permease n=1 Tax=Variovorax paradoxus TaxID=34073 RepID=UPI003ED04191